MAECVINAWFVTCATASPHATVRTMPRLTAFLVTAPADTFRDTALPHATVRLVLRGIADLLADVADAAIGLASCHATPAALPTCFCAPHPMPDCPAIGFATLNATLGAVRAVLDAA